MLRCILIIAFVALTSACGGGKNSPATGKGEIPPDTSTGFKLGGTVTGLTGNIVLANGKDTLTLSANSSFQFPTRLSEGALYDVKIVALPANQLCELRNSKNYAYRDHMDIVVECANLVEKAVQLSLPSTLKLNELRLLSNYQAKGGLGEDPLDGLSSKLVVYNNSFISLRNANNKTLFLSYVDNLAADKIELNGKTTAIALMLLEPTIISAIQDRGLKMSDAALSLANQVNEHGANENGKIDVLADEIEALVESKGDLTAPSASLIAALGDVLNSAINILVKTSALTGLPQASASEDLGVNFVFNKSGALSTKIALTATNQRARYLSLSSTRFTAVTPLLLAPFIAQNIALNSSPAGQDSFTVAIVGPGMKGDISEAKANDVLAAAIASGLHQFFLPSISVMLGLKNPSEFSLSECLSETSMAALGKKAATETGFKSDLLDDKYYKLFSNIAAAARSQFLIQVENTTKTPIKEVFDCEKFGSGVVISSKKAIAIDNAGGIINVVNAMFSPANIQLLPNLFAGEKVSYLAEAIRSNPAEKQWNLSTSLQLDISTKSNRVAVGANVDFAAVCKDPSNKQLVNCSVTWDFGNATSAASNTASSIYTATGQYIVTATAVTDLGVKQTQSIALDVLPILPNILIQYAEATLVEAGLAARFGHVDVAASKTLPFTLTNNGFAPLNIYSITSSDASFKIDAGASSQLAVGASAIFTIKFEPTAAEMRSGIISVATDDPDQPIFTFKVEGSSVGHWSMKKGSSETSFTAVRLTFIEGDSDGQKGLQIRLFGSVDKDYPQIRLALKDYDKASPDKTYSLDDIAGSSEVCFAFFAEGGLLNKQYCTAKSVTDSSSVKNLATISPIAILSLTKKMVFDFDAVSRDCMVLATSCETIHIFGEARY